MNILQLFLHIVSVHSKPLFFAAHMCFARCGWGRRVQEIECVDNIRCFTQKLFIIYVSIVIFHHWYWTNHKNQSDQITGATKKWSLLLVGLKEGKIQYTKQQEQKNAAFEQLNYTHRKQETSKSIVYYLKSNEHMHHKIINIFKTVSADWSTMIVVVVVVVWFWFAWIVHSFRSNPSHSSRLFQFNNFLYCT